MCRRGFLAYLYEEINQAGSTNSQIFTFSKISKKFILQENISFHLFTTHTPCGDASIFSIVKSTKQHKRLKLDSDLDSISVESHLADNFTGAKLLEKDPQVLYIFYFIFLFYIAFMLQCTMFYSCGNLC